MKTMYGDKEMVTKKKLFQPAVDHLIEPQTSIEADSGLDCIHFCHSDRLKHKGD